MLNTVASKTDMSIHGRSAALVLQVHQGCVGRTVELVQYTDWIADWWHIQVNRSCVLACVQKIEPIISMSIMVSESHAPHVYAGSNVLWQGGCQAACGTEQGTQSLRELFAGMLA